MISNLLVTSTMIEEKTPNNKSFTSLNFDFSNSISNHPSYLSFQSGINNRMEMVNINNNKYVSIYLSIFRAIYE